MNLAAMINMQLKKGVPVDSITSIVAPMRDTKISACLCKNQPCNCDRNNTRGRGHPLGFSIPAMNTHLSAVSPSPDLAYLLSLQSLTRAHYTNNNEPELPKRVTTSPQVTSSNQVITVSRRRKKKDALSDVPDSKRSKSSSNRDNQSEDKKYQCEYCGDSFGYKHVLQNHVRTHTGEKPFKCLEPECGKRFTRDHHLKTHMRLHTGEKPFLCEFCDKKFVQVANLRRHMRVHTGERPYACDFESCTARFSDSNQLNAHRLMHKEAAVVVSELNTHRFIRKEPTMTVNQLNAHRLTRKEPTVTMNPLNTYRRANKEPAVIVNPLNAHRLTQTESEEIDIEDEIDMKPLTRRDIYLPYYQYLNRRAMKEALEEAPERTAYAIQEEPEDLSLKRGRRILP